MVKIQPSNIILETIINNGMNMPYIRYSFDQNGIDATSMMNRRCMNSIVDITSLVVPLYNIQKISYVGG